MDSLNVSSINNASDVHEKGHVKDTNPDLAIFRALDDHDEVVTLDKNVLE